MDSIKTLFTTGEFADICGIKKQTLYHYDAIGLIKPEIKNENGYRYYSLQQTEIFFVIEMLKDVGMPLNEIKDFLHTKKPKETIDLLNEKELLLDEKILKMQQTKQIIQNKRRQIEKALTIDFNQLLIKEMPSETYVLSKNILNSNDKEFTKSVMSFIKYTKREVINTGYPVGGVIRKEQLLEGNYWNYQYLYMRVEDEDVSELFIKKPGKYAIGYHQGSYRNIDQTYNQIKKHIKKCGYHISGDSFEEYVIDEVSVSGEDNYVTKIMIKVEESR